MKYIVILFCTTLLLNSCIRNGESCQISKHIFEIPATLTPVKDTFEIGDTISIVSEFSNPVFDLTTQKEYYLEDFNFHPAFQIGNLAVNEDVLNKSLLDFDVILDPNLNFKRFDYSSGRISYTGEYNNLEELYSLKYKLVPKKAGFYIFAHFSEVAFLEDNQDFSGRCRNAGLDVAVKLNDGADNNISFLNDSPNPHYNDWVLIKPDQRFHNAGAYCFYVVE